MKHTGLTRLFVLTAGLFACGGAQEPAPAKPADSSQAGGRTTPEGFFTLTPNLIVPDIEPAIDYYVKVFGATKRYVLPGPDGKPFHGEIQIGDSIVMLGVESAAMQSKSPKTLGGTPAALLYYVENTDAVVEAVVASGGMVVMPPQDMFWGDRWAMVMDPFGHRWSIATHKEDLTMEQIAERQKAAMGAGNGDPAQATPPTPGTPAKSHVPEGYHTLTPALIASNAAELIEFYKTAFGARERTRSAMPDGRLMHAEVQIGNSILMLSDEFPEMGDSKSAKTLGGTPFGLMIYVPDTDATFHKAVAAGATAKWTPSDAFWGDRYAGVDDPSGHYWGIATPQEQLTEEQIMERMKAQYGNGQ